MTKSREHWIKSPWTISIGTATFSLLLTMGYDFLKEKPVLTTVWVVIKWIANLIWAVLNFNLKVWWIIGSVFLFILITILINRFKKKETLKPVFYAYREDRLKRWKWTWDWNFSKSENAWLVSGMKAHCPKCDTPMINHSSIYSLSYLCPRCDFRADDSDCDDPNKIEMIILDNVDRFEAKKI